MITPIERYDNFWVKRDDKFQIGNCFGGKVRSCWNLAQNSIGLITAGSRSSPQVNIVSQIAKVLNIPSRAHVPMGSLSPELLMAKENGTEIIQHKAGYNNVIKARAREDAIKSGWTEIPFGMECNEAVIQNKNQVKNIPKEIKRIVVPVGSGMSLSGILHGLSENDLDIPVLGIIVGANPEKTLIKYAPWDWRIRTTLINSGIDYAKSGKIKTFHNIKLDPIYESKCVPFLQEYDLFWIVGIRATA
jgi:1-aminocyclopropane-1-carboxylate deaminase/D-cysteine desulfhydrase-like pyridoxal-dependent ACC family enzyme